MNRILLIIFLFLMTHIVCAQELENFYLKPSSENLNTIVLNFPEAKDEHASKLELTFLSCALRAYPNYTNTLINNFEKYSTLQKNIVLHALYVNEGKGIFKKLNIPERNFPNIFSYSMVDNIHLAFPKTIEDIKNQSTNLDYLWAAFFATGNKKYVNIMLDYMKKENNESVKTCSAEFINRQILSNFLSSIDPGNEEAKKILEPTDLVKKLKIEDPDNSKHLVTRFLFYSTLWWSLQANKQLPPMKMRVEPASQSSGVHQTN